MVLLHSQVQFLSSSDWTLQNEMLFMFKIALCGMKIIIAMTYVWDHVVTHTILGVWLFIPPPHLSVR
jgi:hypothetical protein